MARLAVLLLVSGLAACGGVSSRANPQQTGGTGTGGAGSTGGSASTGGTSVGGASICAGYDDQLGSSVRVSILNDTAAPIYLGSDKVTCSFEQLFQVADADGAALPGLSSCRFPCALLQQADGVPGCPDICLFPNAVALQPGEVMLTGWDGLFSVQRDMPSACASAGQGGPTVQCDQAARIQPGTFTFSARAGTLLDCSQTTGGPCQMCMTDGNGGCSTPGSLIGGTILHAEATVALDPSYGIYESAPPGAGASPGAGDPILQLTVELVFTTQ